MSFRYFCFSNRYPAEILLVDNEIIVLRSGNDCKFFVSGPIEEVSIIH